MIVKKTKQLGNFKRGINLYIPKKRIVSAVLNGIVAASTNTINVVDTFGYNGTIALSKINSTAYSANTNFNYQQIYCEAYSDNVWVTIFQINLYKVSGYWLYRYEGIYNCDENYGQSYDISLVQEVTNGIIPTTGWSTDITITAA
jgi:hypothetical protein